MRAEIGNSCFLVVFSFSAQSATSASWIVSNWYSRVLWVTGMKSIGTAPRCLASRSIAARHDTAPFPEPPAAATQIVGFSASALVALPDLVASQRRRRSKNALNASLGSPKYTGVTHTNASASPNIACSSSKSSSSRHSCFVLHDPQPSAQIAHRSIM